ncbi:AAA family ATPase [Clostridium sp. MB40-C1]|uniref:AAA family ATPase n=1 Tax=Clostridium sp. MB40-C1 TaxID=3070996 RepID=UPI0027E1C255|nr:AAA family ATPase [Clostridium sp. MB40-C1]WMJ81359.1 AAA family ATPase [Clostridium sp. MB40-C1]
MNMELMPKDVKYKFDTDNINFDKKKYNLPEYTEEVYKKIRTALDIENEGYNVYLIDDFCKVKLDNIKQYVSEILKKKNKPKDICYVVNDNPENPFPLFLSNGKGIVLKETVENIQEEYLKSIYNFYNSSNNKEKEDIIDNIHKKRNELVNDLIDKSHDAGFEIRSTGKGFTFIPLKDKDDEAMTEKEYDELGSKEKEEILNKVSELKIESQKMLEELSEIETVELDKIRKIIKTFLNEDIKSIEDNIDEEFIRDSEAIGFLRKMCREIEENVADIYSMVYEDDEEKISDIVMRYDVNVLVDNSEYDSPRVIFEEDPSITNLLGSIEYKNQNGTYVTDISLIKGGSLLKANEGCLILRANDLLTNANSYYNLKKTVLSGNVSFDFNKGYVELLSLKGLEPEPIHINEKIIIIGDYDTYDILYNYDSDFKKMFKIKAQYKPVVETNNDTKVSLIENIVDICNENKLNPLDKGAVREVSKFLARKAEHRDKVYFNIDELSKLLMLANNKVIYNKRNLITEEDILEIAYEEDMIEKEIREIYTENKILIDVRGKKIGQINGLSVIDSGYFSFGKPIRITCSCYKGDGEIVDVQKQSELSGSIHSKAVNILRGLINQLFGRYDTLPVNFHLSFEQVYGKIDGDSASVAELISMISAMSKIPIKQNIAVTGSINQFGEVQPIGGVNDKIEGFFKVCKAVDEICGKGVLIPYHNKDNIVLSREVENAIEKKQFHIYVMKDIKDAINILMGDYEMIINTAEKEIKKYKDSKTEA